MANDIPSDIEQLQRTVEMFEAIAGAQPDDSQTLEILKEAYLKLGQRDNLVRICKQLAKAYRLQGEVSKAIFECETVLHETPGDTEARTFLDSLLSGAPMNVGTPPLPDQATTAGEPTVEHEGGLPTDQLLEMATAGDRALASVLIAERIATPQAVEPLLDKLKSWRETRTDFKNPLSLFQLLTDDQIAKPEDLLLVLAERSKLPYLPLSTYDLDRDAGKSLPLEICWQLCLLPFDKIGRATLIVTANPFDETSQQLVSSMLNRNVFWYLSSPVEITTAIRQVRDLDATKQKKGGA